MHEPARRRRPRLPAIATAIGVACLVAAATAACSKEETAAPTTTVAAKPGVDDALRVAQAAQDPLLATSPKVFSFGPVEQHPYACGAADGGCGPRESLVSRGIGGATNRVDLAKYFVNNMSGRNWQVEGVYCDPEKEQYVVLGSKKSDLAKGYPGRFELLAFEDIQARITVPAFGSENAFNLVPADNRYPTGTCPAVLTAAYEEARKADGKPVTSVAPGTVAPAASPTP